MASTRNSKKPKKKAAPAPKKKAAPGAGKGRGKGKGKAKKAKLIKILLQNRGEDVETPWAEDLGPVAGKAGARRVRLVNVPFLHAKPTYGDVITVEWSEEDGFLTWDARGVAWKKIHTRIVEDGGRYAAIVDYLPPRDAEVHVVYEALCTAAEARKIVPEGCFGPRDGEPGRMYLAVPNAMKPTTMIKHLTGAGTACKLTLVHPD